MPTLTSTEYMRGSGGYGNRRGRKGHNSMKKVQQSKDDENLVKLTYPCRYNWLKKKKTKLKNKSPTSPFL